MKCQTIENIISGMLGLGDNKKQVIENKIDEIIIYRNIHAIQAIYSFNKDINRIDR